MILVREDLYNGSRNTRALHLIINKSLTSNIPFRPPTSCADIGTQCDAFVEDRRYLDDKLDNPLSDTSTWNTELPNIADVQLCSSPELLFDCEHPERERGERGERGQGWRERLQRMLFP